MKKYSFFLLIITMAVFTSCGSIKSSLKNIDNTAVKPSVKNNQFILTEYAPDGKYGYDKDYPINLGFENEKYSPKKSVLRWEKEYMERFMMTLMMDFFLIAIMSSILLIE